MTCRQVCKLCIPCEDINIVEIDGETDCPSKNYRPQNDVIMVIYLYMHLMYCMDTGSVPINVCT